MATNDLALSTRVNELEKQVSELKGQIAQNDQAIAQNNLAILRRKWQVIWQIVIFALIMASAAIGALVLFPISSR